MIKIQIKIMVRTKSIAKVSGKYNKVFVTIIYNRHPDTFGVFCYFRYKVLILQKKYLTAGEGAN